MKKELTIKIISFLEKLSNDYIAGDKTFLARGKENFNEAERLKEKITSEQEVLIHSLQRQDGKIIAIGDDYKQGTVKEMRVEIFAVTETGAYNINELSH